MKIKPKIGVVSCSGECCSLGTVSRTATRKILEDLKPREAREFPTVAVDGCHKLCATKAIEMYSGKTAFTMNVKALLNEWAVEPPVSRRELTGKDMEIVVRVAQEISHHIDVIKDGLDGKILHKNGLGWRS